MIFNHKAEHNMDIETYMYLLVANCALFIFCSIILITLLKYDQINPIFSLNCMTILLIMILISIFPIFMLI